MSASPPKEDAEQPAESPPDDPDAQMNPDQQSSNPQDLDVKGPMAPDSKW
ncbi:putative ccaat-binding factor complex subunit [Erysiphe neolycopersici]|uniref:Putative ccaat-binding factor complex subunit n=1 Tax=Erysiphe neolycopersici TaxID=212602 RepID=A0A420I190_9PEZI|nr:putative ccaat-binding factor complex subunit [Erysiphe neolycopersici]